MFLLFGKKDMTEIHHDKVHFKLDYLALPVTTCYTRQELGNSITSFVIWFKGNMSHFTNLQIFYGMKKLTSALSVRTVCDIATTSAFSLSLIRTPSVTLINLDPTIEVVSQQNNYIDRQLGK